MRSRHLRLLIDRSKTREMHSKKILMKCMIHKDMVEAGVLSKHQKHLRSHIFSAISRKRKRLCKIQIRTKINSQKSPAQVRKKSELRKFLNSSTLAHKLEVQRYLKLIKLKNNSPYKMKWMLKLTLKMKSQSIKKI